MNRFIKSCKHTAIRQREGTQSRLKESVTCPTYYEGHLKYAQVSCARFIKDTCNFTLNQNDSKTHATLANKTFTSVTASVTVKLASE